jgi:hypothetical protein
VKGRTIIIAKDDTCPKDSCIIVAMSVLTKTATGEREVSIWGDDESAVNILQDNDDDLALLVSVYASSAEDSDGLVDNVYDLLRAYGFTRFKRTVQAPGSRYISITVIYKNNDKQDATGAKEQLANDLTSKEPPKEPKKRRAVKRLQESLWKRAKRKTITIVLAGSAFLGGLAGDIAKDAVKEKVEDWLKNNGPKIVQTTDDVIAAKLPPLAAKRFHDLVKGYVEKSPNKAPLPPPRRSNE